MAYVADLVGYEDWNGDRYEGSPDAPEDAAGFFMRYTDVDTGEVKYHWTWTYMEFYEWDEWIDHIALVDEGHGIELA